ncbi:hypothetical protein AUO94_00425 [Planococcus kocurii]|uniref:Uncharacterized protein n=1 Tax=Planococcus kocurii TaxID=1374 RepID=A0ABM5WSD0_9BACL|nr:hypothetical protein [Planococcus kocurii]ALS77199.1 hypothetical protein AUO94_00425 [Planococcus kocurii]
MDIEQAKELNEQKRNEMLLKILEEEYGIDRDRVTDFLYKMIESMPFEYYDKRALNSLKHGMNMKTILPCKLQRCVHSKYCVIHQSENTSHIEIGSPCRLEIEQYLQITEGLDRQYASREFMPNTDVLVDYIMATVKSDRNRRLIALEGGFMERPGVSRLNNKGLSLGYRYWGSTRSKVKKAIDKLNVE